MKFLKTPSRGNPALSWVLRVFLLLTGLFFMLFSFDAFQGTDSFWHKLGGFLIHNVFAFFIFGVLYVAWKREHLAGILLVVMSICMVFIFGGPSHMREATWLVISLPFLVGVLFLANYYLIKSNK